MKHAPVRLCCMQRHYGVVCPDGLAMCCLCFERVDMAELAVEDGSPIDICKPCYKKESTNARKINGQDVK